MTKIYDIPHYKSDFWERRRATHLLGLFRRMAAGVPAYADFLRKQRINPSKIKTFRDFENVPAVTKSNYLRAYPLEKLAWKGSLARGQVFTVTSGSTGAPFYFPRTDNVNAQSAAFHKIFLDRRSSHRRGSTLVIVGFGMGAWIGGVLTYQAFKRISDDAGYPISIFTPGSDKKGIFAGVRALAPKFDNLILCGYPPFIKDVIDGGRDEGIDWKKFSVRIVFAAEAFSEEFRDYVTKEAGVADPLLDTANIYGSADLGTMAMETPIAIALRRGGLFKDVPRLPTFAQFCPGFVSFESPEGELLCSGDSAVPLLRYAIGDRGEVASFADVVERAADAGVNFRALHKGNKISTLVHELPFVSVYERADLATKLYGAIIYPEHVKKAMYAPSVSRYATGRFTLATKTDQRHNQYLEINVELRPGVKPSAKLEAGVGETVMARMLRDNAEYAYLAERMREKVLPRIRLWRHEYPEYFRSGGKQKWVDHSPPASSASAAPAPIPAK